MPQNNWNSAGPPPTASAGDVLSSPATPSIYDCIVAAIDPTTGRLNSDSCALPDEPRPTPGGFGWVAGARDMLLDPLLSAEGIAHVVEQIVAQLRTLARSNAAEDHAALYALCCIDSVVPILDPLLAAIAAAELPLSPAIHTCVRSIAREGRHLGPIKVAMALLGEIGDPSDRELVLTLGRHEEFTHISACALRRLSDRPLSDLWQLAKGVRGWGRISLVRYLVRFRGLPPEFKDWLLREGYRNSIMHEELAYYCATAGDLRSALEAEWIDDDLLIGAGELLAAMISGCPGPPIRDYADAMAVIDRYLVHLRHRASSPRHYLALRSIHYALTEDADTGRHGWTDPWRERALEETIRQLDQPHWPAIIERGLSAADREDFFEAARAARLAKVDSWPAYWARLQQHPTDSALWPGVMDNPTAEQLGIIIPFALAVFPLDKMATGPGTDQKSDVSYGFHYGLEHVLNGLGRFPGVGWPLVATGLQNPLHDVREAAIHVLRRWGRPSWPEQAESLLRTAYDNEPREKLRVLIAQLLGELAGEKQGNLSSGD